MGLNFFKIIQKIESAFMFILLHGGLETIILFVFGEELYNKYKINVTTQVTFNKLATIKITVRITAYKKLNILLIPLNIIHLPPL